MKLCQCTTLIDSYSERTPPKLEAPKTNDLPFLEALQLQQDSPRGRSRKYRHNTSANTAKVAKHEGILKHEDMDHPLVQHKSCLEDVRL